MDWKPQPKQILPLQSPANEIFFGGGRGSGKTETGIAWLTYDVVNPQLVALVIRRNADDLKDWNDRATLFFARCGATRSGNPPSFTFPSGARIRTGHLNNPEAFEKYQGHEYQRMLIEEIAQIPREETYTKLLASNRTSDASLPAQCFSTGNPSGPGFQWVKERFVDVCNPGEVYMDPTSGRSRAFFNGTVDDNEYLMKNDPTYIRYLDSLPPGLREAWRFGEWREIDAEGAYWAKELEQAKISGRICKIPFDKSLPIHTYWDLGFNDSTAIWLVQIMGKEVRVIEYFEDCNRSFKSYIELLKEWEESKGYRYGTHYFPHDMTVHEYGLGTTREQLFCTVYGSLFNKTVVKGREYAIVKRVASLLDGIEAVRVLLPYCYFDVDGCKQGLHALRHYQKEFDEKKNRWKDGPLHDWSSHASSAFMGLARTVDFVGGGVRYTQEGVMDKEVRVPRRQSKILVPNYVTGEWM